MLPIPAAIQTLLKSKIMVGEDRPTGYIKLKNQPLDLNLLDPASWTTWRTFVSAGGMGNVAETVDLRAVGIYEDGSDIKMAFAPSVAGILDGTEVFDYLNAVVLKTLDAGSDSPMSTIALIDGKLHVAISWRHDNTGQEYTGLRNVEFWRDTDGNGNGLTKVSDVAVDIPGATGAYLMASGLSLVHKLGRGENLVMTIPTFYGASCKCQSAYSSDNGSTWSLGPSGIFSVHYGWHVSQTFLILDESSFVTVCTDGSSAIILNHWTNNGANVTYLSGCSFLQASFATVGKKHYMVRSQAGPEGIQYGLYQFAHDTPDITNILTNNDWVNVKYISSDRANVVGAFMVVTKAALVLQHALGGSLISGVGTPVQEKVLRPKSITVDRSKGSASQATVVLDNKNGQYAPDPAGPWNKVIWPNGEVEIYLGYGKAQQLVFSGLLDELTMRSYPAEISFTARDYSKRALDQMVQWTENGIIYYIMWWEGETPEYIFRDLAHRAGWDDADIITDVSGISLDWISFSQEQYADAFQRLAELCGFEWFCDEAGKLYFRLAVEPTPTAVYSFIEGVDIFSLDYTISDAELYYKVVVITQDADGNTISATADYAGKDAYNVPSQKTLIIQATDLASTIEQCATLAAKAAEAIKPKPRQVNFVVIGQPYLQIGDCIQVTETSSTISEIYRIFELSHQMNATGSPVFTTTIKCYHYAAA